MEAARQKRFTEFLQPNARILILAPHPDDECLGTGGLIQLAIAQGCQVFVLFMTNGDNNPWPQRYVEKRWFIGPEERKRWGNQRQGEAKKSLQLLGQGRVESDFLGLPDAGILDLWKKKDAFLLQKLTNLFVSWQPTLVVMPSEFDRHSDHRATHAFGVAALTAGNLKPEIMTYLIHRPWFMKITGRPKPHLGIKLTEEHRQTKLQAIQCHETQMALSRKRFCKFATAIEPFNFYT